MSKSLMDKITQGRQYRSMTMECRAQESEENKSYIVEGYATTFNEPYDMGECDLFRLKEQVSDKAFDNCEMDDVIFQYDHEGRVYARISNGTLKLEKDEHGLKIIADLGGTEEGRKLYDEIQGGYTTKMSFGFMVRGDSEESKLDEDGKRLYIRTITDISRLYDVSAVSLPANDGTVISARSYFDGLKERLNAKEAERLLQEAKEALKLELEKEELKKLFK